jgi:hypothetical protein
MAAGVRKPKKTKAEDEAEVIARMEAAGPSDERLRELVRKHPAPQQWFYENGSPAAKIKRNR